MTLGSKAAVPILQSEPSRALPPQWELQMLGVQLGLGYTELAGTQGFETSPAAEVYVL